MVLCTGRNTNRERGERGEREGERERGGEAEREKEREIKRGRERGGRRREIISSVKKEKQLYFATETALSGSRNCFEWQQKQL
jgi:hypothetical protein